MTLTAPYVAEATGPHPLASTVEHIPVTVYPSSKHASRAVAQEIADLIQLKAARGERTVLGLATGSTPTSVYDELVRLHREEGLSFRNVVTFNLDEYCPMQPDELQSYHRFMREHLFDHIDIDRAEHPHPRRHAAARARSPQFCQDYERQITRRRRDRLPDPGHRPHGPRRLQRARLPARQPHPPDHARPRDAPGRRQRLLRRVERPAQGDHHGRGHDHVGPEGRAAWRGARARRRSSSARSKARSPPQVARQLPAAAPRRPDRARHRRRRRADALQDAVAARAARRVRPAVGRAA